MVHQDTIENNGGYKEANENQEVSAIREIEK